MLETLQILFQTQKKQSYVLVKNTNQNLELLILLKKLKLIYFFQIFNNNFKVVLRTRAITSVNFFSKPGCTKYCKASNLKKLLSNNKIFLIKTTQGLLTAEDVITNKVSGELLCEINF